MLVDTAQWDDDGRYQGGVSGQGDRTSKLTNFVKNVISATKFDDGLPYVETYDGISITERQFNCLEEFIRNPKGDSLVHLSGIQSPQKYCPQRS